MNDLPPITDYAFRPKRQSLSTTIKLLLVLTIAVVFFAVFPLVKIGPGNINESKARATLAQIHNLQAALETFRDDCGRYPSTTEGFAAFVNRPSDVDKWRQQMDEIPQDSWGNPFRYRFPGIRDPESYDLDSAGPDGIFDTADDIHKDTPITQ